MLDYMSVLGSQLFRVQSYHKLSDEELVTDVEGLLGGRFSTCVMDCKGYCLVAYIKKR